MAEHAGQGGGERVAEDGEPSAEGEPSAAGVAPAEGGAPADGDAAPGAEVTGAAPPAAGSSPTPSGEGAPAPAPAVAEPAVAEPAVADPAAEPAVAEPTSAIEELSPAEEATYVADLLADVGARRRALAAIPDGPRPRLPGETYRRRQMLVDWHLQVNYIGIYLAVTTLLVIGFLALNYVFIRFYQSALQIQQQRPFADETDFVLLSVLNIVLVLVLVIGMAVYAIIQSHRIAGPVLRFRRAIRAIRDRDYDFYVQLREKDHLQDLAEQINELNGALKAKDLVVADAVLALERLAEARPEVAAEAEEILIGLGELVLPEPESAEPEPAA